MNRCRSSYNGHKFRETEPGTISSDELAETLKNHRRWLETDGKEGERAQLSGLRLVGLDFRGSDLRNVIFRNSDLSGLDLTDADLSLADLRGARLVGANLSNADLTDARSLTEEQLALTDLSNAKLPGHLATFDGLQRMAEVTAHAKAVFVTIIAASLFSLLTITSVSHADLIKNTMVSKVPTVDIIVDIGRFFLVVPPVLLGLYVYFHLTLQNLWCYAASLPEVFQDGLHLNRKASPWLLNSIFEKWRPSTNSQKGVYAFLGFLVSILLAWFIVPMTLLFFWAQYLVEHDWTGSIWLTLVVGLTVFFGVDSFLTAKSILKSGQPGERKHVGSFSSKSFVFNRKQRFFKPTVSAAVVVVALMGLAGPVIDGYPDLLDRWMLPTDNFEASDETNNPGIKKSESFPGVILRWFDNRFFADLRGIEVSVKEEGWNQYEEETRKSEDYTRDEKQANSERRLPVKPALLNRKNLRGANAAGAFLVKAELRYADLRKARFYSNETKTNMEGAIMTGANLRSANLTNCRLRKAYLDNNANLEESQLNYADIEGANLRYAILRKVKAQNVILRNANLEGAILESGNFCFANFENAILDGADIKAANLAHAQKLTQHQIDTTCCDEKTILPYGLKNNQCLKNKRQKQR